MPIIIPMPRLTLALGALASCLLVGAWGAAAGEPAAAPPADKGAETALQEGHALFDTHICGTCHALGDAGASGAIGPSLDHRPDLTRAFIVERVTHGQGAMPPFEGQMSDEEIGKLADYIVHASRKE